MSRIATALNRFGLGARLDDRPPGDAERWLLGQFDNYEARPAAIAEAPTRVAVAQALAGNFSTVAQSNEMMGHARRQQRDRAEAMSGDSDATDRRATQRREARRELRHANLDFYSDLIGARTNAALHSPTPFIERLVHFWANHFAISAEKQTVVGFAGLLEFEAIRPHVLGKFEQMLSAVERHPAMLLYLDQSKSIGPGSALAERAQERPNRRARGLNENLAREIFELHTLGVRGGYDQTDVVEFAKALTGWTVAGLGNRSPGPNIIGEDAGIADFVFAEPWHEPGTRHIMGRSYVQQGVAQADAILADLARHPSTATHLATKLARHFAADDPPQALVDRLANAYRQSDGDLTTVYRALIASPEVWQETTAKFRTPWDWEIAALRAVGTEEMEGQAAAEIFEQLGQPVWKPGSPAGYEDVAGSWAGPDALVRRVEIADQMAKRSGETIDPRHLAPRLFPGQLSENTAQSIARAESQSQGLALLLVSPEFQRR